MRAEKAVQTEDAENAETNTRAEPDGFWRTIIAAVVIGNVALLALLWLQAPAWLAAGMPTAAIGCAGVIIEYRRTCARKNGTNGHV